MAYYPRDTSATRSLARKHDRETLAEWYLTEHTAVREILKAIAPEFHKMSDESRKSLLIAIDGEDEWNVPDSLREELALFRMESKRQNTESGKDKT